MSTWIQNNEAAPSPASHPVHNDRAANIAALVIGVALVATLIVSTLYGLKFGTIDESVSSGGIVIEKDGITTLVMDVDDELNAEVRYLDYNMKGVLKLAGADEDTILFELTDASFANGVDASEVVFLIRMPRTGLQGDFSGTWMMYFSFPPQVSKHSDWIIVQDDKTAFVGTSDTINAIATQRNKLLESSTPCNWEKRGSILLITIP